MQPKHWLVYSNAFLFFTTAFIKHHIREPVWYLSVVDVSADKQQQGIGSQLLHEQLEIIDKAYVTPCVLDTQRPVNCKVYERLGFRVMEYTHTPGGRTGSLLSDGQASSRAMISHTHRKTLCRIDTFRWPG
ncbi:hypothetical protein GCM10023116_34080 [Kistimonas scapharcae]|uniref:N-acetyltransferase domain-containing protein n=1 Tax=Kistimonas scapharcae TaxID=1036133 RepID=A0ABP8V7V7_9GAMM